MSKFDAKRICRIGVLAALSFLLNMMEIKLPGNLHITFDSLPHNSAIVLTLSYCGVTHKEGYKHLFVVTVVTTTLATIVNIIMAHLGVI